MNIQLAQEHHLSSLAGIELEAVKVFPPGRFPEAYLTHTLPLSQLEEGRQRSLLWVALSGETVVGFALVESQHDFAHLVEVGVLPAFSRHGIGRQLVEHCLAAARDRGYRGMGLTTFEDLPWNAPFYHRCGFRIVDERDYPLLKQALDAERADGLQHRVAMFAAFL